MGKLDHKTLGDHTVHTVTAGKATHSGVWGGITRAWRLWSAAGHSQTLVSGGPQKFGSNHVNNQFSDTVAG